MNSRTRREFLKQSVAVSAAWSLAIDSARADEQSAGNLYLAPFRFDVTPPLGHSLCGGWIKPVVGVDDKLEAIGFVLLGAGKPMVLCAVSNAVVNRNRPSYMLSWLQRLEKRTPIVLSSLRLNDISLIHLPAEPFIQYQLRSQQLAPTRFVATAAYGDGGPWYIPVKEEYPHGGYEVGVAFCDPEIDDLLTEGMRTLLG